MSNERQDTVSTLHKWHVLARISPPLLSSIMHLSELDKSSQHQKHGAFILTAVVVILLVVEQELF